ncbi:MAG: isopentenyl phosphate kinase family protein [Candidatus Thermoplasmatota archaeon]|nr:isopentenyl phosphate kinase family protein [Candidatus Thermoplasmatota archaeon]
MIILKIGGSVITNKSQENTFKKQTMDRLSKEIKRSGKKIILVHGAGSFGHITAKKYGLQNGFQEAEQIRGFSLTHKAVQKLNSYVIESLYNQDIPAISLPPHSMLRLNNHMLKTFEFEIFNMYLKRGFFPVTFGDVVLDDTLGISICSGDLLVLSLVKYFKPEKAIFVTDEDGLYTKNPKINSDAELINSITENELENLTTDADSHDDVTEGMKGKIDTIKNISKCGIDTILLNGNKQGRLYNVLVGEDDTYTIVHGGRA